MTNEIKKFTMLPQNLTEAARMAEYIAMSNMFGCTTKEQAFSIMVLADAEGLHPGAAFRDYHVIKGKPTLKADAMLARFQQSGGKVEWLELTDQKVTGKFSHPQGGEVTISWSIEDAKKADLTGKDNWKKFPRAMLRSRVASEGIRTVFPVVNSGLYTPEEVADFDDTPKIKQKKSDEWIDGEIIQEEPAYKKKLKEDAKALEEDIPDLSAELDEQEVWRMRLEEQETLEQLKQTWECIPVNFQKSLQSVKEDCKNKLTKVGS